MYKYRCAAMLSGIIEDEDDSLATYYSARVGDIRSDMYGLSWRVEQRWLVEQ